MPLNAKKLPTDIYLINNEVIDDFFCLCNAKLNIKVKVKVKV